MTSAHNSSSTTACPEYTQVDGKRHDCIRAVGHDPEKQPHESAPVLSDEGREVTLSWWESWPPSWDTAPYGKPPARNTRSMKEGKS